MKPLNQLKKCLKTGNVEMKRVLEILIWVIIMAYLVVIPGFVIDRPGETPCNSVDIILPDSLNIRFVTKDIILNSINNRDDKLLGYPLKNINTREVEKQLLLHPALKRVEAYKTVDGKLHIEAIQRVPVVRIINKKGMSYYLDQEGAVIPYSEKFTPRVLVASGYISESELIRDELMIRNIDKDNAIRKIHELSCFINSNDFWKAQIEQIYVTRYGEFELVPRVGAHRIIFGGFDNYQEKFRKLYAFFDEGLNKVGWNRYETINLKFDRQIVCTKRMY